MNPPSQAALRPHLGILHQNSPDGFSAYWAKCLGLPVIFSPQDATLALLHDEEGWSIASHGCKTWAVDYRHLETRQSALQSELLIRAAQGRHRSPKMAVDMTAGWGKDAFLLYSAGLQLQVIEQNPVVALLLRSGLERCGLGQPGSGLELFEGNSMEQALTCNPKPQVVYLDPMFGPSVSRAKRDMWYLQALLAGQPQPELDDLMHCALKIAQERIVLKRSRTSPVWQGMPLNHQLWGRAVRYDVYLV